MVAVLSSVAAAVYLAGGSLMEGTRRTKLQSDVVALNTAIRTYLAHGGSFPANATADVALERLKEEAATVLAARLPGLRGSLIDPRLRGEPAGPTGDRAVWDGATQRFTIRSSGPGFARFVLGTASAPVAAENRGAALLLADRDKWVWNFSDAGTAAPVSARRPGTTEVATVEAPGLASVTRLTAPEFSMPGATYDISAFSPTLAVSLADGNPAGSAQLYYSIDGGPWQRYTGSPIAVPPRLSTTLRAYAAAVDNENWEDSGIETAEYGTIFFSGSSAGRFHTPTGDRNMVTNLAAGASSPDFTWGTPAPNGPRKPNELNFTGASFQNIAPDQEFEVGRLSYYNGTTLTNTNATGVRIRLDLNLTSPGITERLDFDFRLLSTPNRGQSTDEDADYVWIPDVSTSFTTTLRGRRYALVLRFGDHGANGFTTIDTFHAHEGKTLTGVVMGRFTAVP